MTRSSLRLTAAFVCVFMLGGVAGALVGLNATDLRFTNFLNRTSDPKSLADRIQHKLTHDYQLDASEQARIAPLTQEMAQNLYLLRHRFAVDMLATLEKSHRDIGRQMTPAQRAAYENANVERMNRAARLLQPEASATPHS